MTLYRGSQAIENLYVGSQAISEVYYGSQLVYSSGEYFWVTINPTPSDATVTFDAKGTVDGNRIRVKKGTTVNFKVSAEGYYDAFGVVSSVEEDTVINEVDLQKIYYQNGEVIFESGEGGTTHTLTTKTNGIYDIICIGAGGGASVTNTKEGIYNLAGGGAGGGFHISAVLPANREYQITIGKGGEGCLDAFSAGMAFNGEDSRFAYIPTNTVNTTIADAYAGDGGDSDETRAVGGDGGAATDSDEIDDLHPISIVFNSAGGNGKALKQTLGTATGGTAVYESYGKGGDAIKLTEDDAAVAENGNDGYVKVTFLHR